MLNDYAALTIH